MNVREQTELNESRILCKQACLSADNGERSHEESQCPLRTVFQRDRDRIIHSKSFRRLKHKTQVFLAPHGDHYRTRLTHTLEVSQIARTISRALRLNEDLTEAIALGHDLGHTPFGHAGEDVLNSICSFGFHHYEQSVRVVDFIENHTKGLNLTKVVKDGIINHTNGTAITSEGNVVRLSDKIAYINHDIDDAINAGILNEQDLPTSAVEILGHTKSARITTLVTSVVENGAEHIALQPHIKAAHDELRSFLFDNIYLNGLAKAEDEKARSLVEKLYRYYIDRSDLLPEDYQLIMKRDGVERAVCDYISGMSDIFAIETYQSIFIPRGWSKV